MIFFSGSGFSPVIWIFLFLFGIIFLQGRFFFWKCFSPLVLYYMRMIFPRNVFSWDYFSLFLLGLFFFGNVFLLGLFFTWDCFFLRNVFSLGMFFSWDYFSLGIVFTLGLFLLWDYFFWECFFLGLIFPGNVFTLGLLLLLNSKHEFFLAYSNKDNTVRITCPLQANSNITGNEVFMVTVSSWANESFIEVFEWNDVGDLWKCTHTMTSYNKLLKDGTGGVLSSQSLENFTIVICGGQTLDDSNSDLASNNEGCITVSEQYSKASGSLFIPRIDAASLVIDNGNSLWVTGGYDGVSSLSASELIQPHDDPDPTLISFSEKQRLLYSRRGHCLVKIGPNVAILTGGVSNYFKREDKTLTVNISTMDWKEKVPLNIGRSNHACGVLIDLESQMKIAVTAGGTENGIMTNSVEILKAESEEQFHNSVRMWEFGPNLPDAMSDAASASTADQGTMFVIGGTTSNNDDGSTYVHMLQCADLQCQWTKLDRELIAPSSHGLAFLLPSIPMADRRLVGHQCGVFNETRGKV